MLAFSHRHSGNHSLISVGVLTIYIFNSFLKIPRSVQCPFALPFIFCLLSFLPISIHKRMLRVKSINNSLKQFFLILIPPAKCLVLLLMSILRRVIWLLYYQIGGNFLIFLRKITKKCYSSLHSVLFPMLGNRENVFEFFFVILNIVRYFASV